MDKALILEVEKVSKAIFQKDRYFQNRNWQLTYTLDTVNREVGLLHLTVGAITKSMMTQQTARLVHLVATNYLIKDGEPIQELFEGFIWFKYRYPFKLETFTTAHEVIEQCEIVSDWLSKTFPEMSESEIEFLASSNIF